jgi:hypothetical protein
MRRASLEPPNSKASKTGIHIGHKNGGILNATLQATSEMNAERRYPANYHAFLIVLL